MISGRARGAVTRARLQFVVIRAAQSAQPSSAEFGRTSRAEFVRTSRCSVHRRPDSGQRQRPHVFGGYERNSGGWYRTGRIPGRSDGSTSGITTASWRGGGMWTTAGPTTRAQQKHVSARAGSVGDPEPVQSVAQLLSVAPCIGSSWQQEPAAARSNPSHNDQDECDSANDGSQPIVGHGPVSIAHRARPLHSRPVLDRRHCFRTPCTTIRISVARGPRSADAAYLTRTLSY